MTEIVSDNYFPPNDKLGETPSVPNEATPPLESPSSTTENATSLKREENTSALHSNSLLDTSSSICAFEFNFVIEQDETVRGAIETINALMQAGDINGAVAVAEASQLTIDMLALNGTQLAIAMNMTLKYAVRPICGAFLFLFDTAFGVWAMVPSLEGILRKTAHKVGNNNTTATSYVATREKPFLWGITGGMDVTNRVYAEVTMLVVCVILCLLIFSIRRLFRHYSASIDTLEAWKQKSWHVQANGAYSPAPLLPLAVNHTHVETLAWEDGLQFANKSKSLHNISPTSSGANLVEDNMSPISLSRTM
ncbi:hypothetical protein, conserved [Trypanosoma brucei gambiense DAL972]|uniref:Uncharacterized protein n=1 Tax=Trypanosoma brucei gambiense (strain MHOM/CI/86/DAL972) TaxID=679716 RepID=C9ZI77_TRYB9|nr:hypothetical protein, conserved [Trypanosoma brucei gambiense DAL972]CBH08869.1 hypothetical protein, conserved [Trypanosoma brucei gambiense DAL972]|eukprot:XP_011771310.1 hypothetical protein, conserved [Trypanosoma brucei gambiense DAL972]